MSISSQSWESVIDLVNRFYDKHLPLYYTNMHIELTCNVLAMFLNKRNLQVVCTNVSLVEPIQYNSSTVFLSIPLIASLVNRNVDLPPNRVEFINKIDIFDGLKALVNEDVDCTQSSYANTKLLNEQFNDEETIRFTHILRIVIMCSHFYQHYVTKIPFDSHENFKNIELASVPKQINATIHKQINYNKLQNQ